MFGLGCYKVIQFIHLTKENEKMVEQNFKKEREKVLQGYTSYINQMSNIIAGINHEVSPWLGGIANKVSRLRNRIDPSTDNIGSCKLYKNSDLTPVATNFSLIQKLKDIEHAAQTAIDILKLKSKDIKKLQRYSTSKSNLFDTIETWLGIVLVERTVKCDISLENIILDFNTLNFETDHSPLLLSQIVLNLVKNSVEHNQNMLENLRISIYGDAPLNCIYYEDNGRGISPEKFHDLFKPGITSKNQEKELHGIGLSLCVDYCSCMDAAIDVLESNRGAKFVIYFNYDAEKNPFNVKSINRGCHIA
jgi:signal transduction histidine kinase